MPRPKRERCIQYKPEITYFKPAGIPLRDLTEINLSFEELEAIRLKDKDGLEQKECARRMKISRPTFHRVINSARKKLAEALLCGKAIRIEGGNYQLSDRYLQCSNKHRWRMAANELDYSKCPLCENEDIEFVRTYRGRLGKQLQTADD